MRSQSIPGYPPLAAGVTGRPQVAVRAIPSTLYWLVALAVGSSFYVAIEPAPTDIFFLVMFCVVLFRRGIKLPLDLNPILGTGVIVFYGASVFSLLWSHDVARGAIFLSVTTYLLISWYLVIALLANYGAPMWELIQRAFLVAAVLGALIGFVSHFSTVLQDYLAVQSSYGERARGAFKDPNVYAPFLCAALLLVINQMITRRLFSVISILMLCLFAVEILAAFSRGGYGNVVVALFVFFGLQLFVIRRRGWLGRSVVLVALGSLTLAITFTIFLKVAGLSDFLVERLQMQDYDTKRFAAQMLAFDTVAKAPFGIGPGQSEEIFRLAPHSLYLRIVAENGLLAGLSFLLMLAATLWTCVRGAWRRGPFQDLYACCLAILSGILVNSLVIDSLHWRHFYLFLAIPIGLRQYELRAGRVARSAVDGAPRNSPVRLR